MDIRMMLRGYVAAALVLLAGCGPSGPAPGNPAISHVGVIVRLFNAATAELGRPPKDEQEFKQTLGTIDISLQAFKINSIDEAFISERDNQPLVIAYGDQPAGSDVVVYEQTGVDGKRLIAHRVGEVEEVDAARFAELVPNAAK